MAAFYPREQPRLAMIRLIVASNAMSGGTQRATTHHFRTRCAVDGGRPSGPRRPGVQPVTWPPDGMVITGRTMDWPYSFNSHLYAIPRGLTQDGAGGVNSLT